jgi:hypothetical protein
MSQVQSIAVGKDLWEVRVNGMPGKPFNIVAGKRMLTLVQCGGYADGDVMPAVDFHDLSNNPTGMGFRVVPGGELEYVKI